MSEPRRPRIGITSFATPGGSGIVATELGLHLAARGYEIHFISSSLPARLSPFTPNVIFHEVETSSYPPFPHAPYSLALATKMTEVARFHELDILHVHYAIPHAASAFLAKEMIAPRPLATITTLHGTDITLVGREPSFFPLTRFVIERSDAVTAVSAFLERETMDTFQVRQPVRVIPNFVDTKRFKPRPDLRASNPLAPNGERLLIHASNLRPVKNVDRVVTVFAQVRQQIPCKLVVVGDGPDRGPAQRLGQRLGVEEDMVFLGNQESVEELIAMADVMLLPSEHESFGLVALEAMSCGTPVVASNRGGLPELLEHGETGFLHSPTDVDVQADSVLSLLRDDALHARVGQRAREVAVERYCVRCVITQYMELYDEVLARVRGESTAALGPDAANASG
ncbi:MAG: N-acetyl-alpha-D-glucosaminyl L-malate synthase BshA [Gemmatimonadetes bacterium]|nr:N-acetyl-alpha-D-glucosaminyl L-malate synthase BshA [Gemmatimonadota bacterium]